MIKIGDIITKQIAKENKERSDAHVSSGKLSASMLGNPLQWQILKYLGVEQKKHDDYTLAKFQRGRDVEDFVFDKVVANGLDASSQETAEYRNVVGLIDIYLESTNTIIEVKSTTSAAIRFITKENKAKENHILQACLYALSKGADTFGLLYVCSDDYRCVQFEYKTADYKAQVDAIIDTFEQTVARKEIPVFQPKQKWQSIVKYSMFPDWSKSNSSYLVGQAVELYKVKNERKK